MLPRLRCAWAPSALLLCVSTPLLAQTGPDGFGRNVAPPPAPGIVIDGAPPPEFPTSLARDSLGRATVRAIKLAQPLDLDGTLDESVYSEFPPFDGMLQTAPHNREPSTQKSDIWVMYDENNVYVTCRCWDSSPPEDWVVNEYRRDTNGLRQNEHFGVMFDTFYDRRSGFLFYANPLEARADYSVVDEGGSNTDWNPVWDVKSGRFDGGWTMEMAIPFKTLRYRSGNGQVWGIQLRRSVRHENEWTYLNPVPEIMAGPQAFNRISAAGTLVGLDLPPAGSNMELKPYAIANASKDRVADPSAKYDATSDVGLDFKYGITSSLTADVTVNTDFAQVEVDEQQVNLTRFSLFFPEKRDFFLEGRGVFDFGGGGGGMRGGGSDTPTLFYSRRIGLDKGQVIPIDVGGRLTGKVGPWGIGLVNIQTGDEPSVDVGSTNYSVVRIKHDIFRRSAIGGIFTNRSLTEAGQGSNQAYGVDANLAFYTNLKMGAWYARTATEGVDGDEESYRANVDYSGDKYGANIEHLKVGDSFDPQVGFRRRVDFLKTGGSLRYSPRPAVSWIRKLTWQVDVDYFEDGGGVLQSRQQKGQFSLEMESSDKVTVDVTDNFERLVDPFNVSGGLEIAPGDYNFTSFGANYNFGSQRRISGNISVDHGDFYNGTITSLGVSQGRVVLTDRFSMEPGVTFNRIRLPDDRKVDQKVFRTRMDYAFTPRMFASALIQYNSAGRVFSSNLRFRWEYRPGSELFLVWTDERDTYAGGTGLRNRAFAIKATRLFRF